MLNCKKNWVITQPWPGSGSEFSQMPGSGFTESGSGTLITHTYIVHYTVTLPSQRLPSPQILLDDKHYESGNDNLLNLGSLIEDFSLLQFGLNPLWRDAFSKGEKKIHNLPVLRIRIRDPVPF
jgi:hypothetical protein